MIDRVRMCSLAADLAPQGTLDASGHVALRRWLKSSPWFPYCSCHAPKRGVICSTISPRQIKRTAAARQSGRFPCRHLFCMAFAQMR